MCSTRDLKAFWLEKSATLENGGCTTHYLPLPLKADSPFNHSLTGQSCCCTTTAELLSVGQWVYFIYLFWIRFDRWLNMCSSSDHWNWNHSSLQDIYIGTWSGWAKTTAQRSLPLSFKYFLAPLCSLLPLFPSFFPPTHLKALKDYHSTLLFYFEQLPTFCYLILTSYKLWMECFYVGVFIPQ